MIMEVSKRLFVGNLPNGVAENEIKRLFEKFGRIDSLELKTKKGVDGDVVSTFAFVDFVTSDAKLTKCLEKVNGSQVKDSCIRVQVAKENFLTRLQSERAASKNDPKTDKRAPKVPPQPAQDYNPMAMFKARSSKTAENEEIVRSNKKQFTDADFKPQEDSKEGNVFKKLESFSGMWKDLDTAPVVVDREANSQINIKEKRKSKQAEEQIEIKKIKKVEDPKKKEMDNQKRIQSLQQRNEALKAKQNLIKSALSQTDSQKNRKVVFNFDDEEEEGEKPAPSQPVVAKKKRVKEEKSGMKLFDDDDEEEDPQAEDERFKLKPHLEGRSGQELLELQSRFAHDDRFKLDARFADDGPEERMQVDDDPEDLEGAQEKDRQLAILSSLVPMAPANASKKAKTIESTAFVRFDPTSKEHTRFEKAKEEKPIAEKPKKSEKVKKSKEQVEERLEVPLPEVSSERYYTTASELKIGSGDSGGFSLLKMFRPTEPEEEAREEEEVRRETEECAGILGDVVETPKGDEKDVARSLKTEPIDSRATNYWKNVGMWHEPFFFQDKDSRLTEAMQFLRSKTDDAHYLDRSQWADQRDRLIRFYKNKIRRLDTNLAALRKRPLESADQADHFYSAQAAAVANAKKPKKKFYRKKHVQ